MEDSKIKSAMENPRIQAALVAAGILTEGGFLPPLQFTLPGELADRLEQVAARKKIEPASLVAEIVEQYLKRHEPK